mmetsp:Transcript_61136/g.162421  ORF Transcript_61136/g.162421 Transcript_61136/m.162421 type:complete len:342 (+) Transcript_61136:604-1629(+)
MASISSCSAASIGCTAWSLSVAVSGLLHLFGRHDTYRRVHLVMTIWPCSPLDNLSAAVRMGMSGLVMTYSSMTGIGAKCVSGGSVVALSAAELPTQYLSNPAPCACSIMPHRNSRPRMNSSKRATSPYLKTSSNFSCSSAVNSCSNLCNCSPVAAGPRSCSSRSSDLPTRCNPRELSSSGDLIMTGNPPASSRTRSINVAMSSIAPSPCRIANPRGTTPRATPPGRLSCPSTKRVATLSCPTTLLAPDMPATGRCSTSSISIRHVVMPARSNMCGTTSWMGWRKWRSCPIRPRNADTDTTVTFSTEPSIRCLADNSLGITSSRSATRPGLASGPTSGRSRA